ncbi:DHH family phosphoesterase [Halogranum rubrum]|nr:bifunctional oligoribonuclease/PAP phosphatase NrnA [Halogranum rubrum]
MAVDRGLLGQVESTLFAHSEVIVALVVGILTLTFSLYALHRLRRPMGARFREVLASRDELAVLMHPNPDPDAMAAAIGVACLAEQVGTDTTLQFTGQIRHQENRAFRTVLDLDLDCIDHVSDLAAEHVVLVDHNTPRGFAGASAVLPFAVVDHHPGEGAGEEYTDVRTDYGSCSSIVAEYFQDIGAKPVPPDQHASEIDAEYTLPSTVATGLLYGILADTKHLTSGSSAADFRACSYLSTGVDEDLLDRIANPQVSAEVLEIKARAIAGRQISGSFAVSDVGQLSNVDAIPQAADELIQLEGVTAVVVCGEREGTVYLSGRSRDDRVHMGRALEAAVDEIPNSSAGGHARMGGGQIQERIALPNGGEEQAESVPRPELIDRLFRSMSGDI